MSRLKACNWFVLFCAALATTGCGSFMARRLVQAPNTYPDWLAPMAPVELGFAENLLTNWPARFVEVGPPSARLSYRVVEPADFRFAVSSTNLSHADRQRVRFDFRATLPGRTNQWTAAPRGTVVLLPGYGLGDFAMAPWAWRLAQDGWRCVLVELRGHGKSTGRRIYFGVREIHDLSQLVDALERQGQLTRPLAAMGESYGAAVALRWQTVEPRLDSVIALAPYASLSNAVLNIRREYAGWLPSWLVRSGLKRLPAKLGVASDELDPRTVLTRTPVTALFVAGNADTITPMANVRELYELTGTASRLIVVSEATHEALPYYFADLTAPILNWLNAASASRSEADE